MKRQVDEIDPIPSKRLFHSIIADYDLNRALCELIDNALDEWSKGSRERPVKVEVDIDVLQQSIRITDNAGGVARRDLEVLVGPGRSGNAATAETIGIFGVGTKRAVVALAHDVRIRSRRHGQSTYQIEFGQDWLDDEESWRLPVYEVSSINAGSTIIDLSNLRTHIDESKLTNLRAHLEATYALFLAGGHMELVCNSRAVAPRRFEDWAFPPQYEPRRYTTNIVVRNGGPIRMRTTAGLSRESSPGTGEYGVYFYCNKRLVARALKSYEVGFAKGLAGPPHPNVSLVRVLVELEGAAEAMPWNSSKSAINYEHPTFMALREWLIGVLSVYAKLSRNWEGDWDSQVFQHRKGEITDIATTDLVAERKTYLPPLPIFRPRFADRVRSANQRLFKERPYARGLADGLVGADLLSKSKLGERNRLALIILDSTLEIAFKDHLVHLSGKYYPDAQIVKLFGSRKEVLDEVRKTRSFDERFWERVSYFYGLRCKLVHERSSAPISDDDLANFRELVERALRKLFGLKFDV